jgi:hypothetical protein
MPLKVWVHDLGVKPHEKFESSIRFDLRRTQIAPILIV